MINKSAMLHMYDSVKFKNHKPMLSENGPPFLGSRTIKKLSTTTKKDILVSVPACTGLVILFCPILWLPETENRNFRVWSFHSLSLFLTVTENTQVLSPHVRQTSLSRWELDIIKINAGCIKMYSFPIDKYSTNKHVYDALDEINKSV